MKVSRVTVLPPTRSRMEPKLGTVSAMKRRVMTDTERKTHRFQLNSGKKAGFYFYPKFILNPKPILTKCQSGTDTGRRFRKVAG